MSQIRAATDEMSSISRGRAWLVFGLSSLFYFYTYILLVSPDVMVRL